MSTVVRALGDGVYVGDYFDGDRRLDIVLRAPEWSSPEQLASTPLATPSTAVFSRWTNWSPWSSTAGPNEIRRVDRRRAINSRSITRSRPAVSLEETIAILKDKVEPATHLSYLPDDGEISYYGSADESEYRVGKHGSQLYAGYSSFCTLLMSGLFRSFVDSLLVIAALPLATVGGVALLRIHGLAADGSSDHDRLYHPARAGCEQCDSAGAPDARRPNARGWIGAVL